MAHKERKTYSLKGSKEYDYTSSHLGISSTIVNMVEQHRYTVLKQEIELVLGKTIGEALSNFRPIYNDRLRAFLSLKFSVVEGMGLQVSEIIMPAIVFGLIRGADSSGFFDEATHREITLTGVFGHMWTAIIRVDNSPANQNNIILVGSSLQQSIIPPPSPLPSSDDDEISPED